MQLALDPVEFRVPQILTIAHNQIFRFCKNLQPSFSLAGLSVGFGQHAEVARLIPPDIKRGAIGGIPAHERDACLAIEDAIGKAGMPSTWQSWI